MSRLTRGRLLRITRTGLSPAMARLSKRFRLSLNRHWPGPRSLATTSGVSVDILSSGYLDVSVPRVRLGPSMYSEVQYLHLTICYDQRPISVKDRTARQNKLSKVGSPIRTSADQSLFAAPHGFSQRTTSFITSQRQGIHRTPLRHLITLTVDAHPSAGPPGLEPERKGHDVSQSVKTRLQSWRLQSSKRPVFHFAIRSVTQRSAPVTGGYPGPIQATPPCERLTPGDEPYRTNLLHDVRQQQAPATPPATEPQIWSAKLGIGCRSQTARWWSQTGSNRRPPACKAGALPAELWPRTEAPPA